MEPAGNWLVFGSICAGMEARMSEQSDNIDVERAAFGLLRNYGNRAEYECSVLIERWEERGERQAAALWRSVLEVVRKKGSVD